MASQLEANAALLNGLVTIVGYQRHAILISTTILIYDHIITLDDEITYIWKAARKSFNFGCGFFFVVRYLTPFGLVLSSFSLFPVWSASCDIYYRSNFPLFITCLVLTLAVWMMILRTFALYRRSRTVLFFLLFLWGVMLAFMIIANRSGHQVNLPNWVISTTRLCLVGRSLERVASIYYAGLLIVDTTIFAMTLYKLRCIRKSFPGQRITSKTKGSELMDLLFRDGIMYYVVVCLTHFFNFLFLLFGNNTYKSLGASFSQSFSTMLVCRLMLRLQKKRSEQPYCTHTSSDTPSGVFTSHVVQFFEEGEKQCVHCRRETETAKHALTVAGMSLSAEENVLESSSDLPDCPKPMGCNDIQLTSRVPKTNTTTADKVGIAV